MTIFRATLSCANEGSSTFVFECGDKDEATTLADDLLDNFNEGLDEDSIHLYTLHNVEPLYLGDTTMELCYW